MTQKIVKHPESNNIKVYVRVRPFNQKELGTPTCIQAITDTSISLKEKQSRENHDFTFDKIFQEQSTQKEVYDQIGSQVITSSFEGINGTIFCYGQTSSGKTHTCVGPNYTDSEQSGILPRLIKQTLQKIKELPQNVQAKMKISMVEIYNEKIKDLFDSNKNDLKIRSNKNMGIYLDGVTEKYVLNDEEAFEYLQLGLDHRSVSFTNMNARSSRSHMMFIIHLNTHDIYTGQAKTSKITLVDLAGSEKISKTGAEGKVLEEAKKINTSLTALGKVINLLSDGKSSHIPYRDSKLTRLLQQSLGGNSLTNLIINISPSINNDSQTLTSIRFGWRAKAIKNAPKVNKSYTVAELLVLLEKAEKKIKGQNELIKELTEKKKRVGGYGAIQVPKMITMHIIKDDEDEQFYSQSQLLEESEGAELKSERNPSITSIKEEKEGKFSKTADSWREQKNVKKFKNSLTIHPPISFQDVQSKKSVCFKVQQISKNSSQKQAQKPHFPEENELPKHKISLINFLQRPSKQFSDYDTKIFKQNRELVDNLSIIRTNLFELKQKYFEIRKQNTKKGMIIERKNRLLEKYCKQC